MGVLGLTGGIGSGKSTVSEEFERLGIQVVDADIVAREVVQPGTPALLAIAEHFGKGILLPNGRLNRKALRELIFSDAEERTWLEAMLHPEIRREITQQLSAATSPYAVLSSPLLLETKQNQLVDCIAVVDLPESDQLERASRRDDANQEQIKAIMAAQLSREARLAEADFIIDNSGPISNTLAQVQILHNKLHNKLINN